MSLLMDALKKAELAKRQGGNGVPSSSDDAPPLAVDDAGSADETGGPTRLAFPDLPAAEDIPPVVDPILPAMPSRLEALADAPREPRRPNPFEETRPSPPASNHSPLEFAPVDPPPQPRPTQAELARESSRESRPVPPVAKAALESPSRDNNPRDDQVTTSPQENAKNLFAAKAHESPAKKNRLFAMAIGVVTLVSTLAIGGYFWWQLQPKAGLAPMAVARPSPPPTPISPATPTAPATPSAVAAPPPSNSAAASIGNTLASGAEAATSAIKSIVTGSATAEGSVASPVARRPMAAHEESNDRLFQVTKVPLRVNPSIARGFDAFERGDYSAAGREYERVLKSEPQNVDALLGLAAIAMKSNRPDDADHLYQKVLIADPQEPTAISALANLRGRINPTAAEQRLKTVATANPDLVAPQIALGSLYIGQERWAEAQQAYFSAYSLDPANPDVLFNLAVSLEHLRQPKLAAQYYALALDAAVRRPAGFDPAQAQSRLRALQP